ncbi:hypothetical protein [Myxococcus hansupus]|uniref:hypothetical protein n=1 Tax=Pseudomyxococcus hansupus TaxID=1297742 RepID=UPI0005D10EB5|nr:hypothetical protein [Myxococcus hansupus]
MRTKATRVLGAGALILGLLVVKSLVPTEQVRSGQSSLEPVSPRALPSTAAPGMPAPPRPGVKAASSPATASPDGEMEALRASLLERYGARLSEPSVQLRMLEQLMRYFQMRSPDGWRELMEDFLWKAFPGKYEVLMALLRNRLDYEKWMEANASYLRGLDEKQRRAALRDARGRLFGPETARQLWASELRNQAVADTFQALERMQGASLSEKLSTYKQRLDAIYGDAAPAHLARHPQETMNRFLGLPSIQQELTGMAPAERARSLRTVRKEMGLTEEALRRWDTLDRTRDARWEAGTRYMEERAELARTLSGEDLEARLQEVRFRYFGAEADVIAQEEASGLFRFTRPRHWGRN